MKSLYLLVSLLSVGWSHLREKSFSDDTLLFEENGDRGSMHRQLRSPPPQVVGPLSTRPMVDEPSDPTFEVKVIGSVREGSAYETEFSDPLWKHQWYQQDYRTAPGPVVDHNTVPVQRMGYNGEGITIGILGDELVQGHPDMTGSVKEVFNAMKKRWDLKGIIPAEPKTTKRWLVDMSSKMAGVIAMKANNDKCGAGIAFNAKIVGITVMDGDTTYYAADIVDGMKHQSKSIDIYLDAIRKKHDGIVMPFSARIKNGLTSIANDGRGKKGSIYVMGAGDGGNDNVDHCGADFVANSIYTFVIASATKNGRPAYYSERCPAIIASAYSSDSKKLDKWRGPGIVSVDGKDSCTTAFGGTPASAAIAAGIIALTLQANPKLTWRDLMHVIAMTAEKAPLCRSWQWSKNGAGFWFSDSMGFGLLNAENMVLTSQKWKNVPKMVTCELEFKFFGNLEEGRTEEVTMNVDSCPTGESASSLEYIEQVELVTTIAFFNRGMLTVSLKSPKGTSSDLFPHRNKDKSDKGFNKWSMRSLNFWGEQPLGKWVLTVTSGHKNYINTGLFAAVGLQFADGLLRAGSLGYLSNQIRGARLLIHGTSEMPKHYHGTPQDSRRTYSYYPEYQGGWHWEY